MASTPKGPPVTRMVDLLVFILLIGSLVVGWQLRQLALFSTEEVTVQGLSVAIPSHSIPLSSNDQFAVVTPDGLIVRINVLPAPPIGVEDPLALVTGRALSQGQAYEVYQTIGSDILMLGELPAGILEYAYVDAQNDTFFASSLKVIRGYELLVGQGEQLYVLTLEAPDSNFSAVEALWPRLKDSWQLKGAES
ncbi:MAG: hypothetical protein ACPGWR_28765 [Ardenticatenaceae bacterium]